MAEPIEDSLLAIGLDSEDDYAEAAAGDAPSTVSRTFQSEADFQAQKASYTAKIDNGNIFAELMKIVPTLAEIDTTANVSADGEGKVKLSKKEVQLLGYAVGEMYYDREYEKILGLCGRVERGCVVDGRLGESLGRWRGRCEARLRAGREREREEKTGG